MQPVAEISHTNQCGSIPHVRYHIHLISIHFTEYLKWQMSWPKESHKKNMCIYEKWCLDTNSCQYEVILIIIKSHLVMTWPAGHQQVFIILVISRDTTCGFMNKTDTPSCVFTITTVNQTILSIWLYQFCTTNCWEHIG